MFPGASFSEEWSSEGPHGDAQKLWKMRIWRRLAPWVRSNIDFPSICYEKVTPKGPPGRVKTQKNEVW